MGSDVRGTILALMATLIYYLAFIVFRVSANRMPLLRGTQPFRLLRYTYTNWLWLSGVIVLLTGVVVQVKALTLLPLSVAQPIFVASLVFILFYAAVFFRERLTGREWGSLGVFGLATVIVGISNGRHEVLTTSVAGPVMLATVVVPGVLICVAVLVVGDRRTFGRHTRPLAGVAYGIGSGLSLGISELSLKGVAAIYNTHGLADAAYGTPYSYVAVGMAVLGLAQLQIGFQRCRLSVVVAVFTVTAKTQLVFLGPLLYKESWPTDRLLLLLRFGGLAMALVALMMFPRHEAEVEPLAVPLPMAREGVDRI